MASLDFAGVLRSIESVRGRIDRLEAARLLKVKSNGENVANLKTIRENRLKRENYLKRLKRELNSAERQLEKAQQVRRTLYLLFMLSTFEAPCTNLRRTLYLLFMLSTLEVYLVLREAPCTNL